MRRTLIIIALTVDDAADPDPPIETEGVPAETVIPPAPPVPRELRPTARPLARGHLRLVQPRKRVA